MPLETNINPFTFTAAANIFGVAHGLTAYGASHTPNFVVVMPATHTLSSWTITYDSVRVSIFNPVASVWTANIFVKKCHTIED